MELSHLLSELPNADLSPGPNGEDLDEDIGFAFDLRQRQLRAHRKQGICSWQWISTKTDQAYRLLPARHRSLHSRGYKARQPYCRRLATHLLRVIVVFIVMSAMNAILYPSYANPPPRYQILEQRVTSSSASGRGNVKQEKIFIAANIINEALIRGAWGRSVLELVNLLGEENVFVSIFENDSGVGTSDALEAFQRDLPCSSSVVRGAHLPLDSFPTVHLPNGEDRVQRITYLAEVRNRLLRPLDPSVTQENANATGFRSAVDMHFDKILFLNDVFFSPLDAVQLLFSTNSGEYRAACAVDFVRGVIFYDSFVVRDTEGYGIGLMVYPWFSAAGTATSRKDVRRETDAVRVRSCWGGMASFDAAVFRTSDASLEQSSRNTNNPPVSSQSGSPTLALHFRGSGEAFWEAAECCLIFADIETQDGRPSLEKGTGVVINPYIRVAYTKTTYAWLPFYQRFERIFEYLQFIVSKIGYPEHNPRRLHEAREMVDEVVWLTAQQLHDSKVSHHLSSKMVATPFEEASQAGFSLVHRQAAPGGFCGQRRMFVMKEDLESANTDGTGTNWENIRVPERFQLNELTN